MDLVPGICPLCPDCHPGRLTKWPGRGSHPGVHAPQRHRWSSRPCPPAVSRPWRRSRSASTIGIKIVMDRTECHRLSVPAFRNESDHTGGRRDSLPVGFAARPLFAFFYPDVFRGTRISAQVLWDIIYCFYRADVLRLAARRAASDDFLFDGLYRWGGGRIFVSLIAPVIFNGYWEFFVSLATAF